MRNLKIKRKKRNVQADILSVGRRNKLVNDLIAMKLVSFVDGEATVLVWPQLFIGKDKAFIRNFIDNLWMYWKMHSGKLPEETDKMYLTIKEPEEESIIYTFSDKDGLAVI